jgi:hypothetical protein
VLGKVSNAAAEHSNLNLRRTCVAWLGGVFLDDLGFYGCI